MKQTNLFVAGDLRLESAPFIIEHGGQMTVVGMNLAPEDEITFQIVYVPTMPADSCACSTVLPLPLSVAAFEDLQWQGRKVRLTKSNPVVIIDAPQGFLIRAVRRQTDNEGLHLWARPTGTVNVTDTMRGFQ